MRISTSSLALMLLIVSANAALAIQSCPHPELNRPRIGLVLGGGGARGSAHIGVIQVLEELQVPVDIVVGTSIGSLVGGLYATGLTGEQLQTVMVSIDWEKLFHEETPREDWPARRKLSDARGLFGPKFGTGKGANLVPSGAISGQNILFFFETLVSSRVQQSDFDALPIPYRAVAADIVTGDEVVIGEGSLPLAMRASMSVPAIFDPVPSGARLLVDGGIANNLPIDVARAMGADLVLAVNVGSPLGDKEQLRTALDVVGQLSSLLVERNSRVQIDTMTDADLLITPPLGEKVTSADFTKSAEGIRIGYEAADALRAELSRYSISAREYRAYRAGIESCLSTPTTVDFVRIDNQSRFSDEVIDNLVTTRAGDAWEKHRLQRDVERIYALGELDYAVNKIVVEDDQTGLEVLVKQDSRGTHFVQTGLDFTGSWSSNALNVRAALLNTAVDGYGSESHVTVQLGEEPELSADLYKYLESHLRYFLRPALVTQSLDFIDYDDRGNILSIAEVKQYGGAILAGREFGEYGAVSVGIHRLNGKIGREIGDVALDGFHFQVGEYRAQLYYDRLDSSFFPTSGSRININYLESSGDLGADAKYRQLVVDATGVLTFGRHSFQGTGRYYTTLDDDAPIYTQFRTGGFGRLSGLNNNELYGQNFAMVLAGYRFRLTKSKLVLMPGYLGTSLEYGQVADRSSDLFDAPLFNGSIYLGFETPIGPLLMGWGFAEGGRERFLLRLGRGFDAGRSQALF